MRNRFATLVAMAGAMSMSLPFGAEVYARGMENPYIGLESIGGGYYGPLPRQRSQKKYRQLRRRNGSYPAARSGRACA